MVLLRKFGGFLTACVIASSASAGNLYCCNDPASGRRICGDTVPDQCRGRGHQVFNSIGTMISEVGPPLTPEQRAQKQEDAKRKKELDEAQREQRRKDAALLETYTSVEDIERLQKRAEDEVIRETNTALERVAETEKRRKGFENEAEFYKNKPLPGDVIRGLKEADNEIQAQKSLIANKQKELESIRARYALDKQRYRELTTGAHSSRTLNPAPAPTPAPAVTAGANTR